MSLLRSGIGKAGLILACGMTLVSADNLLVNNSFEEGSKGWQQWGAVSTTHSYAGARAMVVTNDTKKWSGISQDVPILEGTTSITVSGWMKTDNVKTGDEMWEQAQISIEFLDDGGQPIEYYPDQTALEAGTTDWNYYEKNYGVYPGAKKVKIVAALGNATGTASFDQLSVVQYKEDGSKQEIKDLEALFQKKREKQANALSVLKNGSFEEGKKGWQVFKGTFPAESFDGSAALCVSSSNSSWVGASQSLNIPKSATSVTISGWMKTEEVIRGKEGWDKALFNFEFQNKLGQKVGDYPEAIAQEDGTIDWTYYQDSYNVTEGASQIKLFCQLCNAKGKVWFDDLKVVFYDKSGSEIQ